MQASRYKLEEQAIQGTHLPFISIITGNDLLPEQALHPTASHASSSRGLVASSMLMINSYCTIVHNSQTSTIQDQEA